MLVLSNLSSSDIDFHLQWGFFVLFYLFLMQLINLALAKFHIQLSAVSPFIIFYRGLINLELSLVQLDNIFPSKRFLVITCLCYASSSA